MSDKILSEDTKRSIDDACYATQTGNEHQIKHYRRVAQIKTDMDLNKYAALKRTQLTDGETAYLKARADAIKEAARADLQMRVTICVLVVMLTGIVGGVINMLQQSRLF